jgi:hypothetical protein
MHDVVERRHPFEKAKHERDEDENAPARAKTSRPKKTRRMVDGFVATI